MLLQVLFDEPLSLFQECHLITSYDVFPTLGSKLTTTVGNFNAKHIERLRSRKHPGTTQTISETKPDERQFQQGFTAFYEAGNTLIHSGAGRKYAAYTQPI